eukprot:scaffold18096_cov51-Cylindrotheca_fusiformis.AAC.1
MTTTTTQVLNLVTPDKVSLEGSRIQCGPDSQGKQGHMARSRDSFGCTPMAYLCLNRMPNSNEAIDETLAADSSSRKNEIGRVVRKFERKEILSLLELCLWKVKIDKVTSEQVLLVDRQECRIMSGVAVVIPHVLASFS